MSRLVDALEAVRGESQAHVVTVLGKAGAGRTRLLAAFSDELRRDGDVAQMTVQCSPLAAEASYGPIAAMLRGKWHVHEDDPAEVVERKLRRGVRMLSGQSGDTSVSVGAQGRSTRGGGRADRAPRAGRGRSRRFAGEGLGTAIRGGLERGATSRFCFVCSNGLVHRVQATPGGCSSTICTGPTMPRSISSTSWSLAPRMCRLLVVCSARPALLERRPHWGEGETTHTSIEAKFVARRHIEQMVRDRLRKVEELSPDVVRVLADRADGNAFTLNELLHFLVDAAVVDTSNEAWIVHAEELARVALPATVQGHRPSAYRSARRFRAHGARVRSRRRSHVLGGSGHAHPRGDW